MRFTREPGLKRVFPLPHRLGSGRQWCVDKASVLVSHDLTRVVGGLHVAEPPELTFGRWLEKRGSHEVSCPLSTLGILPPDPRNCPLGTHSALPLPSFQPFVPPRVRVNAFVNVFVCVQLTEEGAHSG